MNVLKIQQEILKDALSGKGKNWIIQHNGDEVLIGTSVSCYILLNKEYLLDTESLKRSDVKASGVTLLAQIVDNHKNAKPAYKTGVLKVVKGGGKDVSAMELMCGDELIYVNPNNLKHFEKSAEFEGTNRKAPVYVYEDGDLVGLVMPMNIKA